jgi:ubiquinone/menaquinone biosynthesis C-methylase UbiE
MLRASKKPRDNDETEDFGASDALRESPMVSTSATAGNGIRMPSNVDRRVVDSFGQEWKKFNHAKTQERELRSVFECYFSIFRWEIMSKDAVGFDLGCGSGRWAYFVAPRVALLHCIDPSADALEVAKDKLQAFANCKFHLAAADSNPLPDGSADFAYALGVLHHVPDPQKGISDCVRKLKIGAPFLLYLYYAFDNRPIWFRFVWRLSDVMRLLICRMPFSVRLAICDLIAAFVYWPIGRIAKVCDRLHLPIAQFPLTAYRNRSFVFMRNDSFDRFGTRLEKRFTKGQITGMMKAAGLERIEFSDSEPFWCAIGYKKPCPSDMT